MKRMTLLIHVALFGTLMAVWFGLYAYSDRVFDLVPGLIICSSDCTDFHNLSDFLLQQGRFSPVGGDFHTTPFYWLYIALVAGIKAISSGQWKVVYSAFMAAVLYGFVVFAAAWWHRGDGRERISLACLFVLTVGNLWILTYGRTLLTDFGFALAAVSFFLMLSRARARASSREMIAALCFAVALCFLRPNGVFLVCLGAAVAGTQWLPWLRDRFALSVAAPIAVGLAVWIFSAAMSVHAVGSLSAVQGGTAPMSGTFEQFLEFNYTGDDNLGHDNRLGGLLTNTPYKSWYKHDGGYAGMFGTFVRRVPKIFEVWMPRFGFANNLTRIIFYGALYIGMVGFAFAMVRDRGGAACERALFAGLVCGYLLIFVAMSHVTLRFRLVFDVAFALAAAHFYTGVLGNAVRTVIRRKQTA